MIDFDNDALEAFIHCYARNEDIIKPKTFEKIIANSCQNGIYLNNDKYIVDAYSGEIGFNIKTRNVPYNKNSPTQKIDVVQSRLPILNDRDLSDDDLGNKIIEMMIQKREAALSDLNLKNIYDVVILHHRKADQYKAKIFVSEHPEYESFDWTWKKGYGYIDSYDSWKFRRFYGDFSSRQNCLAIKNDYDLNNCLVDLNVTCSSFIDLTAEEAKKQYQIWKQS